MVKVKIRGIYTTALTKLLLDDGFEIVQPSDNSKKRFNLKENNDPFDLNIFDRFDKQGIQAFGNDEALNAFSRTLRKNLFDVILRKSITSQLNIIFTGRDANFLDVEFPWSSKLRLDEIRGSITFTVKNHHYFKACGATVSSVVDLSENYLDDGHPRDEIEVLLKQIVETSLPRSGSRVNIKHVKLDGRVYHLGNALIEDYNKNSGMIKFHRTMKGKGNYDGLDAPKEDGDYAITEAKIGEWYLQTSYFSTDGQCKGMYININTPIEVYPHSIRYIDLEEDICIEPYGKIKIVDEDLIVEAVKRNYISEDLLQVVKDKINELLSRTSFFKN